MKLHIDAAIEVIRQGDTSKADPFTICVVANAALEAPWNTGQFISDPLTSAAFRRAVRYIEDSLFGRLPGQTEQILSDPSIVNKIRLVSLQPSALAPADATSLVAQDSLSSLLVARSSVFVAFLARFGLYADVVFAVSGSTTHSRASAWLTSDDDARPGVSFTLDGVTKTHRFHCIVPGTVAIHATATSLTALHEFGHAISSYTNGSIVDLYVDSDAGLNNRRGRPMPITFSSYNGTAYSTDLTRDGLGYTPGWQSYHCELTDPSAPAAMDDYWKEPTGHPTRCMHDKITRQFILDRIQAKAAR